ncbi:MAG: putative metalloprotease CJM1_0395 family protein, partial [Candidatus Brocadiales bacterium]
FESSNRAPHKPDKLSESTGKTTKPPLAKGGNEGKLGGAGNGLSPASELSAEEQKIVEQLKARDMEVRAHEQAHKSAGGQYVSGGPTFTYQDGPDGRRYAVGGEVQIDVSKVEGNPEATIQKARTAQRAANAPANPSAQDRSVSAQAQAMEAEAGQDLAKERSENAKGNNQSTNPDSAPEVGVGAENTDPFAFNSVVETRNPEQEGIGKSDVSERKQTSQISNYTTQVIQQVGEDAISNTGNLLDIFS